MDTTTAAATTGMKPTGVQAAPQPTKIATPPLTGIGKSHFYHHHKPHSDHMLIMTYVMAILLYVVICRFQGSSCWDW